MFFPELVYKYEDESKAQVTDTYELECLNDNLDTSGEINGTFFATRGTVDTELYYYYMYQSDSGLKTDKIKADDTYITAIGKSEKPYVEKCSVHLDQDKLTWYGRWLTWYGFGFKLNVENTEPKLAYNKLYISEDCITSDYTIDLK